MNNPIVFMFCGQGSQYYHMGKELFHKNDTFRNSMLKMDTLIAQIMGKSVINEIYNPQKSVGDKFNRILYTHPAIFMVEYSLCQLLLEKEIIPDYLLGTSLGEFSCAALSGILPVEDVIECIVKQSIILESYCSDSGMMAVVGNPNLYHETPQLFENSELTSVNYHSHFVIAGRNENLSLIANYLNTKSIINQVLPVNYGFHSSHIDAAEKVYKDFLKTKKYKVPSIPFVSCMLGGEVSEVDSSFLWEVVRKPIQFQKSIQYLERLHNCIYFDLGPSGTLANFVKQNLADGSENRCYPIITPFNQEYKQLSTVECLFHEQTNKI